MFFKPRFYLILGTFIALVTSDSCKNPSGTDCGWYKNCLEKAIPCGSSGYAMKYATVYCNKYDANLKHFSTYGQSWVRAVKKCLQKKLAPLLSQTPKPSCATIKQFAFDTHVPCYVKPTTNRDPSFCSLSLGDYWQVLKTIKGAFLTEFISTVKGGWKTLVDCWKRRHGL
ncbi:uncharacterized protein LOC130622680 [Hydractinia symbiolongicarpus]|uniref:uncharacterized protein LOC130622680 n=1 Tax=Hydractinia symbiolongicarpus TaxID=13093 RepID=UPI00254F857F|nr:uncharacterized protein LOC130622680 [Hydractinia symbiolongicarpus]